MDDLKSQTDEKLESLAYKVMKQKLGCEQYLNLIEQELLVRAKERQKAADPQAKVLETYFEPKEK